MCLNEIVPNFRWVQAGMYHPAPEKTNFAIPSEQKKILPRSQETRQDFFMYLSKA
jgi:hypothetical protein